MKHYVCIGGCGGVSDKEGVCEMPTCGNHKKPFVECSCTNGMHNEVFHKNTELLKKEEEKRKK